MIEDSKKKTIVNRSIRLLWGRKKGMDYHSLFYLDAQVDAQGFSGP